MSSLGLDHDLAEAMVAKLGMSVEWEEFTYAQILGLAPLKTNRVDFYGTAVCDRPDRREGGISFVDYIYEPFVFFALRTNAAKYPDPTALCGESVAATRGDPSRSSDSKLEQPQLRSPRQPAIKVASGENSAQNMLLLKQGRVAAAVNGAGSLAAANAAEATDISSSFSLFGRPCTEWVS
ncbi:ABC-type amino acid transport substrate-binding protein [Bradyrhizobium sp. GM6.1]